MHIAIKKFIEGFEAQARPHNLQPDCLTSGGIRLEVSPSTDAAAPTEFRLSFPSPMDISDAMYPMFLLLFVLGKQFDTAALMMRQAAAVRGGRRYSERIGDWNYTSYSSGARWHTDISVA